MDSPCFRHPHRVTYAECTLGNHVYYARYLNWLEEARGEFFRHLDAPLLHWQAQDTILPVIECHLRYRAAARYDDLVHTEVWLTELERVRLKFSYRILGSRDEIFVEAWTLHACTSVHEKPKRLPEELAEKLRAHLRA
jgi:acyl-CoA thioester hydrolase